jgi:acetoin utilization deacetylase AcuC-like enzyme
MTDSNHTAETLVFYHPEYNDTGLRLETFVKADFIAASLRDRPLAGVTVVEPAPATFDELRKVHDEPYVIAVRDGEPIDLGGSNCVGWDERLYRAVCRSTGGVRDAALWALANGTVAGSLSSGLHHAGPAEGNGYCTFNGLVVAAHAALAAGARRVLILDLDAHCGGGTAACIDGVDGIEQVDVSVNRFDWYPSRNDARLTVTDGHDYLEVVESELIAIKNPESIDLVLYNAGMDPHRFAGGSHHVDTATIIGRERLVFDWARSLNLPVAWVLAGGYTSASLDLDGLVDLHRITIAEAQRSAALSGAELRR